MAKATVTNLVFNGAKETGLLLGGFSAFVEDGQNLSIIEQNINHR